MKAGFPAAVRARAAQSVALLFIAALLAAAAAAGPWYARTVTLHRSVPLNGNPDRALADFRARTATDLHIPSSPTAPTSVQERGLPVRTQLRPAR